jgi:hypothetical protein
MHKFKTPLAAAPLAALLTLAACNEPEPEVVGGMYDPNAAEDTPEAEAAVELPPMRVRETTFRCADNSLVYVSFYTNDSQVGIRLDERGPETILPNEATAAAEEGEEPAETTGTPSYAGEGYRLVGASDASTIQFAHPGGGLQRCSS